MYLEAWWDTCYNSKCQYPLTWRTLKYMKARTNEKADNIKDVAYALLSVTEK